MRAQLMEARDVPGPNERPSSRCGLARASNRAWTGQSPQARLRSFTKPKFTSPKAKARRNGFR